MIDGKYNTLGFYDTNTDNLTWNDAEQWVGGRPPRDRTEIVKTLVTVNRPLFLALSACSSVGILSALVLLGFNYRCRNNRYIQMSHPSSNNLMLLGAILCFISVMLFGLDGQDVGTEYFEVICNVSIEITLKFTTSYLFFSPEHSSSRLGFHSSSAPCLLKRGSVMSYTLKISERWVLLINLELQKLTLIFLDQQQSNIPDHLHLCRPGRHHPRHLVPQRPHETGH